jgi:hypothetical protein
MRGGRHHTTTVKPSHLHTGAVVVVAVVQRLATRDDHRRKGSVGDASNPNPIPASITRKTVTV